MAAQAYGHTARLVGTAVPAAWNRSDSRCVFGDVALVLFLLAQCFDGVFTYVGVMSFGVGIEANPIIAALMSAFGHGPGLMGAKILAGALGICLHLREVHGAVALLTAFYVTVAIVPWTAVLFF